MNTDSDQSNLNSCNDCEVISFPKNSVDYVSKEEIGKWVDKLMEMPEPDPSFSNKFENFSVDPISQVAERILSEGHF